ncbi:MAG: hypothetical protein Q9186_004163 [Xanthomendoza sp. 1 TL-2023]
MCGVKELIRRLFSCGKAPARSEEDTTPPCRTVRTAPVSIAVTGPDAAVRGPAIIPGEWPEEQVAYYNPQEDLRLGSQIRMMEVRNRMLPPLQKGRRLQHISEESGYGEDAVVGRGSRPFLSQPLR